MRLASYVLGELILWPLSGSIPELFHVEKPHTRGSALAGQRKKKTRRWARWAGMQLSLVLK